MIAPRQWSTRFAWAKKSVNNKAYSSAVWFVSVLARQWASNHEPSNTPTFTFELPILMASSRVFTMSLYAEQERGAIGIAPPRIYGPTLNDSQPQRWGSGGTSERILRGLEPSAFM